MVLSGIRGGLLAVGRGAGQRRRERGLSGSRRREGHYQGEEVVRVQGGSGVEERELSRPGRREEEGGELLEEEGKEITRNPLIKGRYCHIAHQLSVPREQGLVLVGVVRSNQNQRTYFN